MSKQNDSNLLKRTSTFHEDNDDFWDISKLIPPKEKSSGGYALSSKVLSKSAEVTFDSKKNSCARQESSGNLFNFRKESFQEKVLNEEIYKPNFNRLIASVTIKRYETETSFYRRFRDDAVRFYMVKGPEQAEYVPFFSYVPQYSQLTPERLSYYLYWRDAVRRGEYPKTDEAYCRLFAYEVLNLPDLISHEEGLSLLCRLLLAYRRNFPRFEQHMVAWIIDYCLLYHLPCPTHELRECINSMIKTGKFPEFFLYDVEALTDDSVHALMSLTCDYQRRPQKNSEHETFIANHLLGMMHRVFLRIFRDYSVIDFGQTRTFETSAFCGSVSAHNIRAHIIVKYHPFTATGALGALVTNAVKYAENCLRSQLGIRSRLRCLTPPSFIVAEFEGYIHDHFIKKESRRAIPSYEKLYEPSEHEISWSSIAEIEKSSWNTTRLLIEEENALVDDRDSQKEQSSPCFYEKSNEKNTDFISGGETVLSRGAFFYLQCVANNANDEVKRRTAQEHQLSEEACVEEINHAFYEEYGDVLLEYDGACYRPLNDYTEEMYLWIRKMSE